MSLVANKGRDFFMRKDRGVISFADVTEIGARHDLEEARKWQVEIHKALGG